MLVDAPLHRLVIAHTSSKAFAIVELPSGRLVRQLYLAGPPHGIAIDTQRNVYLVGTSGEPQVVAIDRTSLAITRIVRTTGPVDALALDSRRDRLFADEDNGQSIWVLGPSGTVLATIHTPQDSDKVEYDAASDRLYQNFTTIDSMLVIDPVRAAIVARWSTLPAKRPHGLAIDHQRHVLYVGGANGWLTTLDINSGRVIATLRIANNVDQIALDVGRRRLYCASGDGWLSVVNVTGTPTLVENISVPLGAHTLAVDPASGDVWISYGTARDDFIMRLVAR